MTTLNYNANMDGHMRTTYPRRECADFVEPWWGADTLGILPYRIVRDSPGSFIIIRLYSQEMSKL